MVIIQKVRRGQLTLLNRLTRFGSRLRDKFSHTTASLCRVSQHLMFTSPKARTARTKLIFTHLSLWFCTHSRFLNIRSALLCAAFGYLLSFLLQENKAAENSVF